MKIVFVSFILSLSTVAAQAGPAKRLFESMLFYPRAGTSYYTNADERLAKLALEHCKSLQQRVQKISSIQIQVDGDFTLNVQNATFASSYPTVSYSALVQCN